MGKILQTFGTVLGTASGIIACSLLTLAMLWDVRFFGGLAWAGVVFWGLLSLVGFRMRHHGFKKHLEAEAARYKVTLTEIIRRKSGKVTPLDLATALGIDLAEAKSYLDLLVKHGEATPELSDQFTQYYQFTGGSEPVQSGSPPRTGAVRESSQPGSFRGPISQ